MDIEQIVSIVYFALGSIAFIAGIVARCTKSSKARKIAEKIASSCVDVSALISLITEAETHAEYDGESKRDYVVTRYLKQHDIEVEELYDIIDTLVAFTKTVNITAQIQESKKEREGDNDARGTSGICRIAR